MKRILVTLVIIIVLLTGAAIVLPAIYKDDVIKIVKKEINKNIDAKVNFEDVSLSLFRSFPHFSLGLEELSVVGKGAFESDTLLYVPTFNTTLNLISVINSEPVEVIAVKLNEPRIKIKILETGEANYDITKNTESDPEVNTDTSLTSEEVQVVLQKVKIDEGYFVYDDATIPYHMELKGISHVLKGDLTQTTTLLNTFTRAQKATVVYDDVEYLSEVFVEADVNMKVDFNKMKFTFSDNEIKINEVPIKAEGWFHMLEDAYDMDIAFHTKRNQFKPFLSLIPAIYKKDFESINTSGEFEMTGFVRGQYSDDSIPAYYLEAKVANGAFSYPTLPDKIEDVAIDLTINNSTGVTDDVVVDVTKLSFTLANNPFSAAFLLRTPVSDPYVETEMDGNIDLASVMQVYPFSPGSDIRGELDVNLQLKGNLSAIENERYRDFKALGFLALNNVEYSDSQYDVNIDRGQFNFSPEYVDMTGLDVKIGESDFYANGKLTNILGYVLKKQTIQGELNVQSQTIDVNELLPKPEETTTTRKSSEMGIINVPPRMHFDMSTTVNEIFYKKIKFNDVAGKVQIRDRLLILNDLKMNTFNGMMSVNGSYATPADEQPKVDLDFDMQKVSVNGVAENFVVIEKLAPALKKARGDVSMNFNYSSGLQSDMLPKLSTVDASGKISIEELRFEELGMLEKLGDELKVSELRNPVVKNAGVSFEITDGSLFIKPFDMKLNGMEATFGGTTNLDQSIDYQLLMNIPRAKFGQKANKALEDIVGEMGKLGIDYELGEVIPLKALIKGSVTDPRLETELAGNLSDFKKDLKGQVNQEIEKKKDEAKERLNKKAEEIISKARKQGDKIIAEAKKQAESIRKKGQQAAEEVRKETDKRAEQINEKAEEKGMLAQMAAKEAAKKARKEGYNKADQLEKEAKKKADSIVSEAKRKAEKLIEEAKEKAGQVKK